MANDTTGQSGTPTSPNTETLSEDRVFEALSRQRRRFALHCLQKYEDPMALADMADEIAVWENDTDIVDISAEEVKRVYISLYHTHIPKLADAGIVEYSQEQDMVALSENAEQLSSHVDSFVD